jgi:hypothetical protein
MQSWRRLATIGRRTCGSGSASRAASHGVCRTAALNIDLKAGEVRGGVDIALARALAIEGRVFTQWDEPMANVEITVTRADRRSALFRPAYSDDLGRYRVYGLMPGRYHVCAGMHEGSSDAATDAGFEARAHLSPRGADRGGRRATSRSPDATRPGSTSACSASADARFPDP